MEIVWEECEPTVENFWKISKIVMNIIVYNK